MQTLGKGVAIFRAISMFLHELKLIFGIKYQAWHSSIVWQGIAWLLHKINKPSYVIRLMHNAPSYYLKNPTIKSERQAFLGKALRVQPNMICIFVW